MGDQVVSKEVSGRALREPALVASDHAPSGHGPSGFDPAREDAQHVADALTDAETTRLGRALRPFADLADYISENFPSLDTDAHEVQIEGWPYSLSVAWLREARAALRSVRLRHP